MRRLAALMALAPGMVLAHESRAFEAHDLLTEWVWAPGIVVPIAASAVLYLIGSRRAFGLTSWEKRSFWAGWVTLVMALMSPLHPMGEALFSAHMAQHELLMVLAAPLLVLGRPLIAFLWALPPVQRRAIGSWTRHRWWSDAWSFVSRPVVAFSLHFIAIWGWHIPAAYQATISSDLAHTAQHISFLGTALLFWWTAIRQYAARKQYGSGLFYIFATAMHTTLLGAMLTFSNTVWYPIYEPRVEAWGLTPLEDQQLGGLIMWVPPGFVYLGIFLAVFVQWIRDADTRAVRQILSCLALLILLSGTSCVPTPDPNIPAAEILPDADPVKGKQLLNAYGCVTCHTIPGVPNANANVGPPLTAVGRRTWLAGRITNTPDNMIRWIHNPKSVDPETAMPVTGISEADARHVVRYLYSLK